MARPAQARSKARVWYAGTVRGYGARYTPQLPIPFYCGLRNRDGLKFRLGVASADSSKQSPPPQHLLKQALFRHQVAGLHTYCSTLTNRRHHGAKCLQPAAVMLRVPLGEKLREPE